MSQNLSKATFWDQIKKDHPVQMKQFSEWIDRYKLTDGWFLYIREGIKYHDLPFALQIGILAMFFREEFEVQHRRFGWATDLTDDALISQQAMDIFAAEHFRVSLKDTPDPGDLLDEEYN